MDTVRHVFGVANVIILPAGVLFWFLIHPWARYWRTLGPARTYLIVVPLVAAAGAALYRVRDTLLGADLGTHWSLIGIAFVLYATSTAFELRLWRQLNIPTLIGVPELSRGGGQPGTLLTDGLYGRVRHPRYLIAGIGVIGNALLINYAGLDIVLLLVVPAGLLMLRFEERDLVDRFGEEYRRYQRDVPQLVPRFVSARRSR